MIVVLAEMFELCGCNPSTKIAAEFILPRKRCTKLGMTSFRGSTRVGRNRSPLARSTLKDNTYIRLHLFQLPNVTSNINAPLGLSKPLR